MSWFVADIIAVISSAAAAYLGAKAFKDFKDDGSTRDTIRDFRIAFGALTVVLQNSREDRSTIEKPPGYRWRQLLRVFLTEKTFEATFQQAMTDCWLEYNEALARGDKAEARRVKLQLHFQMIRICTTALGGLPLELLQKLIKR